MKGVILSLLLLLLALAIPSALTQNSGKLYMGCHITYHHDVAPGALVIHVGVVIIMNLLVAFSVEYLEWIELPNAEVLPESDDGITGPITISSPGFPFWDSVQTQVYVCL